MSGLTNKLAAKKFPHRDVTICLDGELAAEREEAELALNRAIAAAEQARRDAEDGTGDNRLGVSVSGPVKKARKVLEDVERRMRAVAVTIRITAVSFGEWNKFVIQNPPRKGKQELFDGTKFFMALARQAGKYVDDDGSVHDIDKADWDAIEASLTDADHDRIAQTVFQVNKHDSTRGVDFLSSNSETTPTSSETSEPLAG